MPNWCEVDCQINFPDETEKKKLQAALDAEIAKAKAEDKGLFVGCKEKYLFFSAYSDDETEILISGDVNGVCSRKKWRIGLAGSVLTQKSVK